MLAWRLSRRGLGTLSTPLQFQRQLLVVKRTFSSEKDDKNDKKDDKAASTTKDSTADADDKSSELVKVNKGIL